MSSNYAAGVPIKKRRFPIIRPPSPTPEEQSSIPLGNESVQKEDSSQSQGSVLSNAIIPESSPALSDAKKDSPHEKVKGNTDETNVNMVESIASSVRVKVEDPSPTIVHPASRADIDSNEKLVAAQKIAKTELNLSPGGTPALNTREDVSSEGKVERESDSKLSKTSGITELSLGINEHLFSSMVGQSGAGSCRYKEKGEPVLLSLSSSKGESSNQWKSNTFELNTGGANMCTNRSNWDLNTTMDAWDGFTVDRVSGQKVAGGFNSITGTRDIKPLISSVGMVGGSIGSGKQILEESESRSNAATLPDLSNYHCNSEDSLHLGLSPPSLLSNVNEKPSRSSALLNSGGNISDLSLRQAFVLSGNLSKVNIKTVKSEPQDESTKHDFKGATAIPKEIDFRAVKSELVERCNPEALKPSTSTVRSVDSGSIKPEPVHEGMQETLKKIEGTSNHLGKMMLNGQNIIVKTTSSADLSICSGDLSNSLGHPSSNDRSQCSEEVLQDKDESAKLLATDTMSASVGHDINEANVSGIVDSTIAEDKIVDDPGQCRLKNMNVGPTPPDSMGNGEGSASDDEKINLSGDMLEEDSYGSDYESDGNHDLGTAMDTEQDGIREEDFEDGEVREPLADTTMEEPICEKREVEPFNSDDSHKEQMSYVGLPSDDHPTSSYVENKDSETEEPSEANYNIVNKFSETAHDEKKTNEGADDKDHVLQESQAVEMPTNGVANCPRSEETEQSTDQAPGSSQGNSATVVQGSDEDTKNTDVIDKNISALPKVETSSNVDDATKDANSGGQKSRIINLRASISSSPGETRTISARSLPTRAGRVPDVALEEDKLCPRGRDEIYTGDSRKLSRDRHQDQSSRNSRFNFMRGRGRISSRIDTVRGNWDSERDFAPEFYNGPAEFRIPRHKYASQTDIEFNSYNGGLSGAFAGTCRGGRKPLNDGAPVFRPRRRSPGGRGGPPVRGIEMDMVHRIPRNISPSRCIGEGSSELVGLRHGEEFMRGLPNDNSNPIYAHPQASFEGIDSQFVRSNRNFLSVQRRGLPRIRSKSPVASRTHAPRTWSPRRRSPDGFGGHSEFPNQRSPPMFRMERMRSPDHSCFPAEMVVRRHGSPYMSRQSNELRDMDSGRDLGHPRSVIPDRSPSGRVLLRNPRGLDMLDPRERTANDDFFGRPMRSGRYQELGADGTNEERRRLSERRGPVRPFRPPFNGTEGEDFHLNAENGPRPFRFHPEDDSDFHNRGNLREREFDRRIKNPPGNAPRRTRNIEEQEQNFRHPGHLWRDERFDDMSRIKRKRF
ncbi:hypothetical protein KPL71_011472 [Citrus sinensis]|nr:hypothetical protein KPL71_011472 [Citrus sinensis]